MQWAFWPVGSVSRADGPAFTSRATLAAGSILAVSALWYLATGVLIADRRVSLLAAGLTILSALLARYRVRKAHVAHLPFTRRLLRILPLLLGVGLTLFEAHSATSLLFATVVALGSVALGALVGLLGRGLHGVPGPVVRVAVVGPAVYARGLADELGNGMESSFSLVGHIDRVAIGGKPLTEVVRLETIDLLLIDRADPESAAFDEIRRTWIDLDVPIEMLSNFYEEHLGRAPLAAIDAVWLRDILRPSSRYADIVRRTGDIVVSGLLLLLFSPVLLALVLLVRRDGSPAFYRQERIGKGGQPFEILKLRSMRPDGDAAARWSAADDDRVTPLGRFMRRTHLDEIPQLINILRGDMALIGPRPEQTPIVAELQEDIPFYDWRHRVRPGLTGWAQVIAGYCGTDRGSAIKTCYDLYYLKYRSLGLDLLILFETARTLLADRQWRIPDYDDAFIPDRVRGSVSGDEVVDVRTQPTLGPTVAGPVYRAGPSSATAAEPPPAHSATTSPPLLVGGRR